MLPTPDTSHVPYNRVYEPAEDSFLLLDTLSSPAESAFLTERFGCVAHESSPLILEVGPGSGIVVSFLTAHARRIMGSTDVLALAVDVNAFACSATRKTAAKTTAEHASTAGVFLGAIQGDLVSPLRTGVVDVLVFNPPYVPTPDLPVPLHGARGRETSFEEDSRLLELSYAGGRDGMETTDRLLATLPEVLSRRGCAYVVLCAQNKPQGVTDRIRGWGSEWRAETVGRSGKQAGWEKLQIVRIWRAWEG